jgi:two-component system sensor histidine kinase AlgZ
LLRILGISALLSAVFLHYWSVYQQAKRLAQAEAQARLQALQARINPHFLFNSMNTIAALIADKPRLAEQAVEDLADLFRATLQTGQKRVTLAQELALCRQYLRIESLRLQQRLRVEWWVDLLPTDALVPILSLQPLLENAIRHGVQTHVAGGVIRIVGIADEHGIKIDVENALPKPQQLPSDGVHMALDNIRQRLQWYYGARGRLEVKQDGEKYQVSLCFPIEYSA